MHTLPAILAATIIALGSSLNPGAAAPPPAPGTPGVIPQGPLVHATLWVDHRVVMPGQVFWIAISLEIEPDWHIYWPGLNDTGMPPIFDWHLPPGWKIGAARWPVPSIHETVGGLVDHVVEGTGIVLWPIKVPEDAASGDAFTISADLEWLVCRVACIAEDQRVQYTVRTATGHEPWSVTQPDAAAVLDMARKKLPEPMPEAGAPVRAALDGDTLVITAGAGTTISFYPAADTRAPIGDAGTRLARPGPSLHLDLDADADAPVEGIIVLEAKDGHRRAFSLRLPESTDEQRDGFALPETTHHP